MGEDQNPVCRLRRLETEQRGETGNDVISSMLLPFGLLVIYVFV